MVLSILSGRKTQTRRVMKPQPSFEPKGWKSTHTYEKDHKVQVGDVFWVRETWQYDYHWVQGNGGYVYKADSPSKSLMLEEKWKPSIFMPKDACRLFLKVIDVRLVPLQQISNEDCDAEGIHFEPDESNENERFYHQYENGSRGFYTWAEYNYKGETQSAAKASFCTLWLSINGEKSWDDNPFVWAYTFEITDKPITF